MIDIGKATRKLFCGVALVGLGLATESHAATELEEREAIVGQVSALFLAEDFGALEQLSRRFRATESRTASGLWHLTLFYAGIKEAINDKQHSASIAAAYAGLEATTLKWADAFPDSPTARIVHAMVLVDRQKFAAAGLMPAGNEEFPHGLSIGYELWVANQSSDYYRRHLLLHELTHSFILHKSF